MIPLIMELAERLVDPLLSAEHTEHASLMRLVNKLTLRICMKGRREINFAALLRLLQRCVNGGLEYPVMRMLVKFIVKICRYEAKDETRQGRAPMPWGAVSCDVILSELNDFFNCCPPQASSAQDDMPTGAARSILRELVKAKGRDLERDLMLLPSQSQVRVLYEKMMKRYTSGASREEGEGDSDSTPRTPGRPRPLTTSASSNTLATMSPLGTPGRESPSARQFFPTSPQRDGGEGRSKPAAPATAGFNGSNASTDGLSMEAIRRQVEARKAAEDVDMEDAPGECCIDAIMGRARCCAYQQLRAFPLFPCCSRTAGSN